MNTKQLFTAIGEIADGFIAEAGSPAKKVRRIRMFKTCALAAAMILLLCSSAFASSVLIKSRSGSSTNIPTYHTVPSPQTLQRDIGIAPSMVEAFSNGYSFQSGVIVQNEDVGEDSSVVERFKSLSCKYVHGDSLLTVHVDGSMAGIQMEHSETAAVYKNSELKYAAYTNKAVPGNYQLTEQDKEDRASGKYVFSFGSDRIELYDVQILGWEHNGLSYTICAIDNAIAKEELVQMAAELIDEQN